MQTQAHTQAALQAQMEAQALSAACRPEGEKEQYLEEKKALQKRPAAPFQRQDKKKAAYQTPQHPVATSSTQSPRFLKNIERRQGVRMRFMSDSVAILSLFRR
ncbi:hypothetical protein Taro_047327 [Colocasia esculenta]|uniref:Uncharacterized protein n=1 Tax=Colocasia esculenta TaxID=4460 RepID=A0A843X0S3_COLES|nr:hypothetical protein [Colocasia esculenta]